MPKELLDLRGIITVLNTPFTEDDLLDIAGVRRNVADALDAGVAGFLVPAMAAEVDKLTFDERRELVAAVLDTVEGRVPVIGGASAATATDRLRHAETLIALGCHGVLASIPFTTESGYTRSVEELAALNPGFLMLQDWDAAGYGLPLPLITRLFEEIDAFRCLKIEVIPAGVKYSQALEATGGRLHISGGWAVTQMIEGLDRGVHAFMPTGMHRIYCRIYSCYAAGDRDGARRLFEEILPTLAFSNQHLDISIHFFKRLLHAQGIYATPRVRPPILPFDAHHERIAQEWIARIIPLENSLK